VPQIRDADRDSLYTLPLAMIPLETPSLRRARMIKNVQLDSVLEMFTDEVSGSGQWPIDNLAHVFDWPDATVHPDLVTLRKLALLPSFDVYSLRVLLRQHGIAVNEHEKLRLSDTKNRELTSYMSTFTRPLIFNIYGNDDMSISSFEDIIGLFRRPDRKKSIEKLQQMAQKLEIEIESIPNFLEDYGDIFLSLSYYRNCLDSIEPLISGFLEWLEEIRANWTFRRDADLIGTCRMVQETLNGTMAAITGCFENFDRSAQDLWQDLTPDRFRKVEKLIKDHHVFIGGTLCSLTVKMETWDRVFPNKQAGSPARRAEFVRTEIRQGIEKMRRFEVAAPILSELR
jgi:hypothetical protein